MNCVSVDISNFEIYFHPGMMKEKSGPVAFGVENFFSDLWLKTIRG